MQKKKLLFQQNLRIYAISVIAKMGVCIDMNCFQFLYSINLNWFTKMTSYEAFCIAIIGGIIGFIIIERLFLRKIKDSE